MRTMSALQGADLVLWTCRYGLAYLASAGTNDYPRWLVLTLRHSNRRDVA
jgi:hypothetical protein